MQKNGWGQTRARQQGDEEGSSLEEGASEGSFLQSKGLPSTVKVLAAQGTVAGLAPKIKADAKAPQDYGDSSARKKYYSCIFALRC